MEVDGKKMVYKWGYVPQIMDACLISWNRNWRMCADIASLFRSADIYVTCQNIFNYLVENVQYKEDPIGQQWIKTPARLLADHVADCKSFSIFTASVLRCLDIDCTLRFACYDKEKGFSHVYVVARDGNRDIIIDAVAKIQRNFNFNEEVPYKMKKDMEMTEISFLSGLGDPNDAISLSDIFSDNRTVSANFLASMALFYNCQNQLQSQKQLKQADHVDASLIPLFAFLSSFVSGKSQNDLNLIGLLTYDFVSSGNAFTEVEEEAFLNAFSKYSSNSVERERYVLLSNDLSSDFLSWWDKYVMADNYMTAIGGGLQCAQTLFSIAPLLFYLVVDNSQLSKAAIEKKIQQQAWLDQLTQNTWCTSKTALNIIHAGLAASGFTALERLDILQYGRVSISGSYDIPSYDPDWVPNYDLSQYDVSSLGANASSGYPVLINNIMTWVTTAVDGFTKVYTALRYDSNSGKYVPNGGGYYPVPSSSDFNVKSTLLYAGIGLAVLVSCQFDNV